MYVRRIPIDFAIPMLIGFGVGALFNFCGGKYIDTMEVKSQEEVVSDSMIGTKASDKVPVVSSIAEMMEEDYFTFHLDYSVSGFDKSAYYDGTVYDICELPSGELVVVDDYFYHSSIESPDDDEWSLDFFEVMPIGQVIHEPVAEELIAEFAQNGYEITDTSFYVDMRGDFEEFDRDEWEDKIEGLSFLVGFIVFFFIRYIMIASGLFSPIIPMRFLRKWKRYIVFYGILYYDENVKLIADYHKRKNYDAAMAEFMKLTGSTIEDARMAMNNWAEIYGEGIVMIK